MATIKRSLDEKIEAVDEIVKRLRANVTDAIAHDAMLRRIHDVPDVVRTFTNTVEGHGFSVVQRGLISLYLLALMRCYDNLSDNRASLSHAIHLLKQPDVFEAVTNRALTWVPGQGFAELNHNASRQKIRSSIREYDRIMSLDEFNDRLTALRQHRDDHVAHSLFDMGEREKVLFGYLDDVLKETVPIVAALALGVIGLEWDYEGTARVWDKNADAFWCRALPLHNVSFRAPIR